MDRSSRDLRSYVDEKVSQCQSMVSAKLQTLEKYVQLHQEETDKTDTTMHTLSSKMRDVESCLKNFASAEELQGLSSNKADREEVRQMREELLAKVSHSELNHRFNEQTKPLYATIAALEKAVQIQDYTSMEVKSMIQAVGNGKSGSSSSSSSSSNHDPTESFSEQEMRRVLLDERLFKAVEEALVKRGLEDEIDVNIDKRMIQLKSFVVHEMNDMVFIVICMFVSIYIYIYAFICVCLYYNGSLCTLLMFIHTTNSIYLIRWMQCEWRQPASIESSCLLYRSMPMSK